MTMLLLGAAKTVNGFENIYPFLVSTRSPTAETVDKYLERNFKSSKKKS